MYFLFEFTSGTKQQKLTQWFPVSFLSFYLLLWGGGGGREGEICSILLPYDFPGSKAEQVAEEWVLTLAAEPGWEDQSPGLQLMERRWQSGLQPPPVQTDCFEKGEDIAM